MSSPARPWSRPAPVTPGKIVHRGELWAGNPTQKLRDLTEQDFKTFKRVVADYVTLSRSYLPDETARAAEEAKFGMAWTLLDDRIERGSHARSRSGSPDRSPDYRSSGTR